MKEVEREKKIKLMFRQQRGTKYLFKFRHQPHVVRTYKKLKEKHIKLDTPGVFSVVFFAAFFGMRPLPICI